MEWIPETYVALMHGALSCNGEAPDLMAALQMWVAQQDAAAAGRNANPQLGFVFLAKELFRLRYSALAMQVRGRGGGRRGWRVGGERGKEVKGGGERGGGNERVVCACQHARVQDKRGIPCFN